MTQRLQDGTLLFCALFCLWGLAGCGDQGATVDVALARSASDSFFVQDALQGTVDAFVGNDPAIDKYPVPQSATTSRTNARLIVPQDGGGGGGGFGGFADIDGSALSPSSDTPYRQDRDVSQSVAVSVTQPVTDAVGIRTTLRAAYGESAYVLTEGAGILTDPISIDFSALSLSGELAAVWSRRCGRACRVDYAGGLGVVEADVTTTVRSALLDVEHESVHSRTYGVASVRLALQPPGSGGPFPAVEGSVRYFGDQTTEIRTSLIVLFD